MGMEAVAAPSELEEDEDEDEEWVEGGWRARAEALERLRDAADEAMLRREESGGEAAMVTGMAIDVAAGLRTWLLEGWMGLGVLSVRIGGFN